MAVDNVARALAAKALGNSAGSVTPEDLEKKYDKTGGAITGDVAIQGNLTVSGTTTTEKEKQLLVEDNVIVTNANKIDLKTLLSGLAINKSADAVYGIMYDPTDDTVKFGEGTLDENNKFTFKTGEGLPIAIREDSTKFTDAHLVKWDATKKCFVDAGVGVQTGPTGPTGPMGATGPTGPIGPAGERGPTGPVGLTGPTGPAGLTTKVTVNGTTYTQSGGNITLPNYAKIGTETIDKILSKIEYISESAIPSPPDEAYEYAVTDLIGYGDLDANLQEQIDHMGNTGPTGPTGAIGAVGPTGPTGAAGQKGDKGEQGAAGTNGKDGAVGPTGPKGDVGDIGPTGPTGPTGAAGAKGEQGAKGETGAQGPVGPTGPGGPVVSMTQSAYDALETKDANTLYVIVG